MPRARVDHGRRVVDRSAERDIFVKRECALGENFEKVQIGLYGVAVNRQRSIGRALTTKSRKVVEAFSARIPIVPDAKVERDGTEGRADAGGEIDFGGRPIWECDAFAADAGIQLQIFGDVVAGLVIGPDGWLVIGLG